MVLHQLIKRPFGNAGRMAAAEFVGTFFFVLTIAVAPKEAQLGATGALYIGLLLVALIYTFRFVCAQFNPAVSVAIFLVGAQPGWEVALYVAMQLSGGFAAALAGAYLVVDLDGGAAQPHGPRVDFDAYAGGYARAFVAEWLFTTLLAVVVLFCAISTNKVNHFYGLAIGGMLGGAAGAVGGISGSSFNPAVATSLQLAQCLHGDCQAVRTLWLYWAAELLGAVTGAIVFLLAHGPGEYHAAPWPGQCTVDAHASLRTVAADMPFVLGEGDDGGEDGRINDVKSLGERAPLLHAARP